MRLISLELQGFKSFPDKTVLKFAPGVTTVVGPNGSGKSNISDAVRWVLGEISSKNMRGSKMEDVIFGGTDTRKPMSYAEVSLTLDNREEDGFSRLASEYDEVTVTRRYNRNGTSEYMINRRPVRLKDINTLFMNTGIGRDGYSIVSQGKAAEIISQKSDERRNVFEEAAGISKYRYQKNDAEKKLAETAQNCERLADIILEKKTNLDKLEKDAEKAKKYLDVYEKKKEADISLLVYETEKVRNETDEKKKQYDLLEKSLLAADNEITDNNNQYERLDIEKSRAKEKFLQLSDKIEQMNNSRFESSTRKQILENDVLHIEENIDSKRKLLSELRENRTALTEKVTQSENNLKEATRLFDETNTLVKENSEQIENLKSKKQQIALQNESNAEKTESLKNEINALNIEKARLQSYSDSGLERKNQLKNELAETLKSTESCREGMLKYKKRLDEYEEKSNAIRQSEEEIRIETEKLREKQSKLNDSVISYAGDLRDIRTKVDSLRRMDELFEGYPQSVSALMNASKAGKLQGIIGPLSHIFTVKSEYSLAVETALGNNIQNIVTENDSAAKAAVLWLKQNNAGRTTFYPLNTMQVTPLSVRTEDLEKRKGYIGIASSLINYDSKYYRVVENLLGRTLVFDNLENANDTAKAFGYRLRIVTKDGQLVNAGGSITGGQAKRESGVLSRSATIDKLGAERIKIEQQKKAAEEEFAKVTDQISELVKKSGDNQAKLKLIASLAQADSNQYTAFETQLSTVNETVEKTEAEIKAIEENKNRYAEEAEKCTQRITEISGEIKKLEEQKAENDAESRQISDLLGDEYKTENRLAVKSAQLQKDVDLAEKELFSAQSEKEQCENEITASENSIKKSEEDIVKKKEEILRCSDDTQHFADSISELTSERDSEDKRSIEIEMKMNELKKSLQELMNSREILSNDFVKLESKLENLSSTYDRNIEYLRSEYEIGFTEAQQLGYPEVTEENRAEVAQRLQELKYKLRGIGSVDPKSIEDYKEAKIAYEEMNTQFEDLTKSRNEFQNTVEILEKEMRTKFVEVMGEINIAFKRVFRELFGGGNAELVLTDPDDVLHCGIDINVAPPGKIIKSLSLLSGGEQAFISIALFFAILNVNPSPFCIFDEIEAALDEVNVAMFASYIKKYSDKTQFITITHRRGTMEVADTLYGVTMAERGISKVLTLNVNEVESKLGVKL